MNSPPVVTPRPTSKQMRELAVTANITVHTFARFLAGQPIWPKNARAVREALASEGFTVEDLP